MKKKLLCTAFLASAMVGCDIIARPCAGPDDPLCLDGEFCKFDEGECETADAKGSCTVIPDVCIEIFQPVCGCDGETYSNECFAWAAGVSIDHEGECAAEGKECGGAMGIECDQGEFCKLEPGSCEEADAIGECIFIGDACPDNLEPVCGCDGETYSNDCLAYVAGLNIDHEGECGDPCRSQCELAAGECEERGIEEFEDFGTTLGEWQAEASNLDCDRSLPSMVAGECADGATLFLYRGTGFTTLTNYYDSETGRFISLTTTTDAIEPRCEGRGYWPELFVCSDAVVTEVICGTLIEEGEAISLP